MQARFVLQNILQIILPDPCCKPNTNHGNNHSEPCIHSDKLAQTLATDNQTLLALNLSVQQIFEYFSLVLHT